jgi:hypothetical protein
MDTTKTTVFVAAVAALFGAIACGGEGESTTTVQRQDPLVKCEGINECKGTSECQSSDGKSACQGLNECKGEGWITVPSEECAEKGGKVLGGSGGEPSAGEPSGEAEASTDPPKKEPTATNVKCEGVNECKGQGACQGDDNACKGHNECKGEGWIEIPAEECTAKGGEVIG